VGLDQWDQQPGTRAVSEPIGVNIKPDAITNPDDG